MCCLLPSLSSPLVSITPPAIVIFPCLPSVVLPPLSLPIPIGGDVAVSTCFTLQVNACSGGGQVLGCHHSSNLLPPLSLTTGLPYRLTAVEVSHPSPCIVVTIPPTIHPTSRLEVGGVVCGGSWWAVLLSWCCVAAVAALHCCCHCCQAASAKSKVCLICLICLMLN